MANQNVLDAAEDAKVIDARTVTLLRLAGANADSTFPQEGD